MWNFYSYMIRPEALRSQVTYILIVLKGMIRNQGTNLGSTVQVRYKKYYLFQEHCIHLDIVHNYYKRPSDGNFQPCFHNRTLHNKDSLLFNPKSCNYM